MIESNTLPLAAVHEVRDHCLCLAAQRAARKLARRFDRAFLPLGITNQQFSLMMALNAPRPIHVGSLAIFLAMDRTSVTAALKALERRDLVTSRPEEKDRRARRILLTEAGREVLCRAMPIWRQEHAKLDAALPGHGDPLRAALAGLS